MLIQYMFHDAQFSRYTSPSNGITYFEHCCPDTVCAVGSTQDTECTAGASFDRMIMKYTRDEYCNMLLTLAACNNRASTYYCMGIRATLSWSTSSGHHCRRLEQRLLRQECNNYATRACRSLIDCTATSQSRCCNRSCGMKAAELT